MSNLRSSTQFYPDCIQCGCPDKPPVSSVKLQTFDPSQRAQAIMAFTQEITAKSDQSGGSSSGKWSPPQASDAGVGVV
jgi:hypothetical protein